MEWEHWEAALKLSTMWEFLEIRTQAIEELRKHVIGGVLLVTGKKVQSGLLVTRLYGFSTAELRFCRFYRRRRKDWVGSCVSGAACTALDLVLLLQCHDSDQCDQRSY